MDLLLYAPEAVVIYDVVAHISPTLPTSSPSALDATPADVTPPDSTPACLALDAFFDPPETLSPLDWGLEFLDLVPELRAVLS